MNLKELLQLCLLGRRTGTLHVSQSDGANPHGRIHLCDGRITHAQTGTRIGEDAFFNLLATPPLPTRFVEEAPGPESTISADPQFLLLEAARRQDLQDSGLLPSPEEPAALDILDPSDHCLVVLSEITPRMIPLPPSTFTIGRHANCSLRLDNSTVSQHHASLTCQDGAYFLQDEGSTNGTFLNSAPVWESKPLRMGDLIRIGAVLMRFLSRDSAQTENHPGPGNPARRFTFPPQGPPRFPPQSPPSGALIRAPAAHAG